MQIRVISQQPPGGRCTLYTSYADALARHFAARAELAFSQVRDAHGDGFPSLWLNGAAIQPDDGVILMPADILAALDLPEEAVMGLAEELEVPLERMFEEAG